MSAVLNPVAGSDDGVGTAEGARLEKIISEKMIILFSQRVTGISEGEIYGAGRHQTCDLEVGVQIDLATASAALNECLDSPSQATLYMQALCAVAKSKVGTLADQRYDQIAARASTMRQESLNHLESSSALADRMQQLLLPGAVATLSDRQEQLRHGIGLIYALDAQIWFATIAQLFGRPNDLQRLLEKRKRHARAYEHKNCCLNGVELGRYPDSETLAPPSARFRTLKRGFDLVFASLILLVSLPLLVGIALVVMCGGRPVFYAQTRVGMAGRPFRCWKFRTMAPDAENLLEAILASDPAARAEWEACEKLRDDPRITATGRFLRKTSLDELPQLLNVFKGDMSLIGPRPMALHERERWGAHYRVYKNVRPGLTGPWQIEHRTDSSYDTRIQSLLKYVHDWSLWLDIKYLLKTIVIPIRGFGAY